MKKTGSDAIIEAHPEERREFLRKALKVGVVAPAVATFSMTGLTARPAMAGANGSYY